MDHKKSMIAQQLKEKRLLKGLTQRELSEKTNISLRSIQRIENGQVEPRMFTLKRLANHLDFPIDQILTRKGHKNKFSVISKIILAIGAGIILALLGFAFTVQSVSFPETTFELILFIAGILAVYTLILYRLFK